MKAFWKTLGYFGLALLVVVGYCGYRLAFGKPFTLNELANRQAFLFLLANPELFTQVGFIDGTILDRHSGRLAAVGVKKRDDDYAMAERFIRQVKEFDRTQLDRQEQITYDVLLDQWGTELSFKRFDWLSSEGAAAVGPGLYPIAPMWGTQVQLPIFLETMHIVRNERTARNYVKRLEASGDKLDAVTEEMLRQAKLGVVLPISLLDKAEIGIKDTIQPSPGDNPLVTTFVQRMRTAKGIDPGEQAELVGRATDAVAHRIYPAFDRMTAALESQRTAAAAQAAGVGRLPDGDAYYAATLRQMTTTDYSPEQVHALGLSEVARVGAEMDALLKSQGLSTGTVAERVQALHKDPRFLLPNDDAGRTQLLAKYQQILDEVNVRMPAYFRTVPAAKLSVQRVPLAAEKGTAGAYYQGAALDGSRPGTFFVNLRDVGETATWTMKTLAYHEGIPGHHFQGSVAQSLKNLPLIRQETIYSAYAEGWALYAERLAAEIGMYKEDPFGDLGRLEAEMFRAARLVVDTGLHAKGWSRERSIAYMVSTTGMNESGVISEVERYMAMPGQACGYKVGQLKILELRERAKAALGPRFSLKDFHAVVLENGALPLTVVEKLVDEWTAKPAG
ncbi:MAG: DUF885 domain-containing protein [Pseudomonadota bacterium]|nr:DUF885 domain-containing protein [Pseudomonadota bacterium]